MIAAYREPDRKQAKTLMQQLIGSLSSGSSTGLTEIQTLGRTLTQRAADVLAYFDRPCTSYGPTEAICECRRGWSWTGWSGWFRSRRAACDSLSNWPVAAGTSQGRTPREIRRSLKRYLARQIYRQLSAANTPAAAA
jgi:hypothetical protein